MTERPQIPTADEMVISAAIGHIKCARNHLLCAHIGLNDLGYEWDDLGRAYSFTAGLAADMLGRPTPPPVPFKPVPDYITESAIAWRAERDRRARR